MSTDLRPELDRMAREIADLKARVKALEPGRHKPYVSEGAGDMRPLTAEMWKPEMSLPNKGPNSVGV